jgi:hypothetical protein
MRKYPGIPEMLEAYMTENATDECWVTVQELRDRFGLSRYQGVVVSAFLRRLEKGPFVRYPYIVLRIERIPVALSKTVRGDRYLVTRRICDTLRTDGEQGHGYPGTEGDTIPARHNRRHA